MALHSALRGCPRGAVSFLGLWALGSCVAPADPWAQLEPSSPCYEVDLRDGLDDAAELRTTFDCLDHHGHLSSLRPTLEALEADDQAGLRSLVEAANAAETTLGGSGLPEVPALPDAAVQELLLEVLSGVPGDEVGAPAPDPTLAPWHGTGPAMEGLLASLRDQPTAVAALAAVVREPSLEEAIVATLRADSEPQGPFVAPMLHHLAAAGVEGDPEGDAFAAWLDTWVVDPLGALPRSFFPLQLLTDDPRWRAEVVEHVAAHEDLGDVPRSVAWLASVTPDGEPLPPGQTSALARILTLLARGAEPVTCTVGVEPVAIDLSFDDLSVRLLRIVAGLEPETLGSASSVWSILTDNLVADAALDLAVASGACPAFDADAQDGLDALDLLTAPEAAPVLRLAAPLLDTTERAQSLPDLADVFAAMGGPQAIVDVDRLMARVGPTEHAAAAARGLQGLASPIAGGQPALRHLLDGLAFALAGEPGVTGPPAVIAYPWIRQVAADDDVRRAIGRLATTWADDRSHSRSWTQHLPDEDAVRSGFPAVRALATEEVVEPLLAAATQPGVVTALLASEEDGPLRALAGALRNGVVSDALAWFEAATESAGR